MSESISRRNMVKAGALATGLVVLEGSTASAQRSKEDDKGKAKLVSGYRCQVKILNSTPATTIVKTIAFFSDGNNDPASGMPGDVSIGPGEAGYRYSYSDDTCITSVEVLIVTDNAGSFSATQTAPANYCLVAPLFELAPQTAIKKGAKKKGPNLVILGETDPKKPGVKTVLPEGRKVEGKN